MLLVCMLVMIAEMAQMTELNHNASATQMALVVCDSGRIVRAAPKLEANS